MFDFVSIQNVIIISTEITNEVIGWVIEPRSSWNVDLMPLVSVTQVES